MAFKRSPLRHSSPILLHRTGWSKGRERLAGGLDALGGLPLEVQLQQTGENL